ncbi:MAG TPA: YdeI/OmpD-associated family protein [Blastocatellia bacterium]|nr:YdeI/OmpD-associated family protein [Blastocatellia bacterium]
MTKAKKMSFPARLEKMGEGDAWLGILVPFNVEETFGSRARVSVKGTLNGFSYQSSIFPDGKGAHVMMVNKAMQQGAKAGAGDTIKVEMELDDEPRTVEVPDDLLKALEKNKAAKAAFEKLSYSKKKLMVDAITGAKKAETRAARVEKTISTLAAG